MNTNGRSTGLVALVVALGGFLMGFDSAVISGVVSPLEDAFKLTPGQVGTAVACLTLSATLAMAMAGPLADRFGRKPVLMVAALAFTISAIWSAMAGSYTSIVAARLLGGFGVGAALLIAPLYIAEIAPAKDRGRLVSFNQLNIVLGFSAAFFSNYFLEQGMSTTDASGATVTDPSTWRWMLAVEALPAVAYLLLLNIVPKSPRWLAKVGRTDEARDVLAWANGEAEAERALAEVQAALADDANKDKPGFGELFHPRMRLVMVIGLGLGFFQQITGINAIFYYATTIFELAGAERTASLEQAIYVGLVNVAFTVIAMRLIDTAGRRPLLIVGTSLMAVALLTNSWAFGDATYNTDSDRFAKSAEGLPAEAKAAIGTLKGQTFEDQASFLTAIEAAVASIPAEAQEAATGASEGLAKGALQIRGMLVLIAIMTYIAGFAISLGPVMWAMFSEIFPTRIRGVAISAAGFFNSLVSFLVQKLFPVGLAALGPSQVFLIFGVFAVLALLFSLVVVPETKGRSLEELEAQLIKG